MKTRTIITGINHEDLVDFLSTALYGSNFLACDYTNADYKKYCDVSESDCLEDKLAKLLLAGNAIYIGDMYAEDEYDFYGNLEHHYDGSVMWYKVNLDAINRGLQDCFDGQGEDDDDSFLRRCAMDFINGDGDMDLPEAEAIMQVILFGELIYG